MRGQSEMDRMVQRLKEFTGSQQLKSNDIIKKAAKQILGKEDHFRELLESINDLLPKLVEYKSDDPKTHQQSISDLIEMREKAEFLLNNMETLRRMVNESD